MENCALGSNRDEWFCFVCIYICVCVCVCVYTHMLYIYKLADHFKKIQVNTSFAWPRKRNLLK